MKKIAPELDSLMWTLAEDGGDRAIEEFGNRNPELRSELLRRIAIVQGLRSAGKKPKPAMASIPRFIPKEPRGSVFQSRPGKIVAGLALAAIAAVAFAVTVLITPPTHPRVPDPQPPSEPARSHAQAPPKVLTPPTTPTNPPTNPATAPEATNEQPPPKAPTGAATLRKANLHIDHAPLLTVLKMIGESCGVSIVPGPGMPNPTVEADYRDMSAMDMLHDLGRKFSFTAFDEDDGSILVVPGVDTGDHPEGTGNEGARGELRGRKIGG